MEDIFIDISEMLSGGNAINPSDYYFYRGLSRGYLYLDTDIDDSTVNYIVYPLIQMNEDPNIKKITLYINSNGGDPYVAMSIVSVIENLKKPITIVILGTAASAAGFVAMAKGKHIKTVCNKYSVGLIHPGSIRLGGNSAEVRDTHDFWQRYEDTKIKDFILSHTNITDEKYESIKRREYWMLADEMLELGIVDEII